MFKRTQFVPNRGLGSFRQAFYRRIRSSWSALILREAICMEVIYCHQLLSQFSLRMMTYTHASSLHADRGLIYSRKNNILISARTKKEPMDTLSFLQNSAPVWQTSSINNKTFRNYQSSGKISDRTIDMDYFRHQNKQNLRQAILHRSRAVLNSPLAAKNTNASTIWTRHESRDGRSRDEALWSMHQQSKQKTLSLLVKAVNMQDQLFLQCRQDLLEVHANKPAIVWKPRKQRRQRPITQERPLTSTSIKTSGQKYQIIQKSPIKRRIPAIKKQKPEIRGWDTIQFDEL